MVKQSGRKTGSFANAFRPPPGHGKLSVDWDAIMRNHVPVEEAAEPLPEKQQLTLEELDRVNRGGANNYNRGVREYRPMGAPRAGSGRQPPFDVDEAVRLYTEEHKTPKEIAEVMGNTTDRTVIKYLKKRPGVYNSNKYRRGGSHDRSKPVVRPADSYTRQTECSKGHDLTLEGSTYEIFKYKGNQVIKNGRACKRCKQERENNSIPWEQSPRNPKNGGDSGWTSERRERQRQKRARDQLACLDEQCGHAGLKHRDEGCSVRDCHCKLSISAIKVAWTALSEEN